MNPGPSPSTWAANSTNWAILRPETYFLHLSNIVLILKQRHDHVCAGLLPLVCRVLLSILQFPLAKVQKLKLISNSCNYKGWHLKIIIPQWLIITLHSTWVCLSINYTPCECVKKLQCESRETSKASQTLSPGSLSDSAPHGETANRIFCQLVK